MTKYTINKVFDKMFNNPIWKIEVDASSQLIAIESRNLENTIPSFHIFNFNGSPLIENYSVDEKEWTLAGIQDNYLILKKVGVSTPLQAGIKIIDITSETTHAIYSEYVIKEIYQNTIEAIHRLIPTGLLFYIDITTGKVQNKIPENLLRIDNNVSYPQTYKGKLPAFMSDINHKNNIWIQAIESGFIWAYLEENKEEYNLNIILSSKYQILTQETVFNHLSPLILQPYFKVKDYIFFLSDTKQKIVSYLV